MRTPAQQAASRANGARSRGPKTPEGKRRSSLNRISHGLLAKTTVLQKESRAGFERFLRQHVEKFAPRDPVEYAAVEELCSAEWRLRRLWSMERKAVDLELAAQSSSDDLECIVQAYNSMVRKHPHFQFFQRYENRLAYLARQALHRLMALQKQETTFEPKESLP